MAIVAAPVLGQGANQPAIITGRVVATETGHPLRGVMVELVGGTPVSFVVTDVDGRFEFLEKRIGRYAVQATKAGYAPYLFGRMADQGEMFDVLAGQRIDRGTIRLSQAAVISGRVHDDAGEPILAATVAAWRIEFPQPGIRWLQLIKEVPTDDRGEYRIHGLMPGQYQIAASRNPPPSADARSLTLELEARLAAERAGVVFPGPGLSTFSDVITAEASAGGETAGMNFTVARPRYVRVSGTILDSAGRPAMSGTVSLRPTHIGAGTSGRYYSQVGSQAGRFSFTNVPAGDYRLQAIVPRPETLKDQRVVMMSESISMPVSASEDIPGLIVQASSPVMLSVSGRVFVDGVPADSPLRLRLFAVPAGIPSVGAPFMGEAVPGQVVTVDKTGQFLASGGGGRVVLRTAESLGLKSVTADGVDVTDGFEVGRVMTLDVHLTSQVSVLEGIVKPSDGVITGNCDVVVFAAEPDAWTTPFGRRVVNVRCDDKGRFRVTGLPTGQYLAAVPADFDRRMWADPQRLERLRQFATPFTVTEGALTEVRLEVRR
ncbi:MAG TPA: carboxypeptidase regulatory-like domain-containing protein [Vicinamibacterales bacterium]|nr:carboxypeptidase regulatory-like domain-containing protein [Vicinamibacterales bacterium]